MKRFKKVAVGLAAIASLTAVSPNLQAQIWTEFQPATLITGVPYAELNDNEKTVIPREEFILPPANEVDYDDGYYQVDLGFDFEYNGEVYNSIFINVNGFVTFSKYEKNQYNQIVRIDPPMVPAVDAEALFIESSSYPVNVLAPFWGDHYYRNVLDEKNSYLASEISYLKETDKFIVQWKNLNINDKNQPSSVANFQLIIYKSTSLYSAQGDIEFCYGGIGGNPNSPNTVVVYKDASVGIKGEADDYMNGLLYDQDINLQKTITDLTNIWQPSGQRSDARIKFIAKATNKIEEWWGDGDVDFSKAVGNIHEGQPQNRFVSINDARIIMKSVATNQPLDDARRRQAYHGDVTHDGRFYFDVDGNKIRIETKSDKYSDDLPEAIASIKQIRFQCNEHDAAYVLEYLGGQITQLPWKHPIDYKGKSAVDVDVQATNLVLGTMTKLENGNYTIPVYVNGDVKGAFSTKFDINANVADVKLSNKDLMVSFTQNRVVIAGANQDLAKDSKVCDIEISLNEKEVKLSGIRLNDNEVADLTSTVSQVETSNYTLGIKMLSKNPFSSNAIFSLNANLTNDMNLAIYDMLGNKVKSFAISGSEYVWDGKDDNGNAVANGVYIIRLSGNDISVTEKVVLSK
jgi:hypothetical protein